MKCLAVFCGSHIGASGAYIEGAKKLGKELSRRNITLVYGGSSVGIMGAVANSAGLGSIAAVIGMAFHTVAYLVKAYSEAFEELDEGVIEALRACGANWFHIVTKAVLPSTMTYLLSWTFLRFEINFSVAVAMGAAAGAGGIGFELFMASGFYFDLREVGFITYAILIIAIILEAISTRMKNRYFPNMAGR